MERLFADFLNVEAYVVFVCRWDQEERNLTQLTLETWAIPALVARATNHHRMTKNHLKS